MARPSISIDVVSDIVCPWCYLGKRRLARALDLMPEVEISVRWRPFRLDATIPPEGIERTTYLTRKFGSPEAYVERVQPLVEQARAEGIVYHFDGIKRSPNTVDAHRLIGWAAAADREDAMVERLFTAYFIDGLDIGNAAVLTELAGESGLDGDIAARLAGDEDRAEVVAEIENAYRIGISGVPSFIVDQRYAVVGAHPPETIVAAVEQAVAALGGDDGATADASN